MMVGVPLQGRAPDRVRLIGGQIGWCVECGRVNLPQVPQQPLLRHALGNPPHAALLHAAKKGVGFLDRFLVTRLFGFLQLRSEPRAHAGEEPAAFNRLVRLCLLRCLVVTLESIGANGNQVNVHHYFGRRMARGVCGIATGTAGLPACSHAPVIAATTAAIESFRRRSSVGSVPFANASKYASS